MLSKYSIILFDSDNTLYNHEAHERAAIKEAFELCGETPLSEEQYRLYKAINDDVWREFELGIKHKDGPLVERFSRFVAKSALPFSPIEINDAFVNSLSAQCVPFENSYAVCKELSSSHTLYIITNGTESVQRRRYEESPLRPFFSGIFIAGAMGVQKPRREYFDIVLREIGGVNKKDVVIVGDSLSSDILGGINSGIDTCWYNPCHTENDTAISPTYEIDNLTMLL